MPDLHGDTDEDSDDGGVKLEREDEAVDEFEDVYGTLELLPYPSPDMVND